MPYQQPAPQQGNTRTITIDSILGGISATEYVGMQDTYDSAIAIDADAPSLDTGGAEQTIKQSSIIRPIGYTKFSSSNLTGNPYWILTDPKDALVYFYTNNGRLVSYSSSLGSETLVGTAGSSSGNGAVYYNNYLYLATNTDVSRYGPLDGSPALTDSVWTGSTLGSQTALVNTTYPSIRGSGTVPNHPMHLHLTDGKLYFGDFDSTSSTAATRGFGLIHYIQTKYGAAEGDTNNGSVYGALTLSSGFRPTAIASYGTDIVIAAIQGNNGTVNQGNAAIFFWNTTDPGAYLQVPVPEPYITAIKNINGILYIFGGKLTATGGHTVYQYIAGTSLKPLVTLEEGQPPLQGAVDGFAGRVIWGSYTTYPINSAAVFAYGSKQPKIPPVLHHVATATAAASSSDGCVTALKYALQGSNNLPAPILGWRDGSGVGADKLVSNGTSYPTTNTLPTWRSQQYDIGQNGTVKKIILNFPTALATNMTITPKIFIDDKVSSTSLTTINSTNYSGRQAVLYPQISFTNNFLLQLQWSGSALLPVNLPITIEYELNNT